MKKKPAKTPAAATPPTPSAAGLAKKLAEARKITAAALEAGRYGEAIKGLQYQQELEAFSAALDPELPIPDSARAEHLAQIDSAIKFARKRGALTALANLLRHRTGYLGFDKPPPPVLTDEDLRPPADPAEHLAELIRVARRGRLTAEAAGSHVAASNYLRHERELLQLSTTPSALIQSATDADLLRIIEETTAALPEEVRAMIPGSGH